MIDRWWISKPTKNTTVTQVENCKDDRKVVSAYSKAQNAQKIPTTLLAIHRHMRLLKWTSRVSLGQLCCCLHIDEQMTANTNQQCVKQQSQNWRCSYLILFPLSPFKKRQVSLVKEEDCAILSHILGLELLRTRTCVREFYKPIQNTWNHRKKIPTYPEETSTRRDTSTRRNFTYQFRNSMEKKRQIATTFHAW